MDLNKFSELFGECELVGGKLRIKSGLKNAVKFIAENYSYDILKEIIAVHNQDGTIELTYNFYSTVEQENLFLSIIVNNEAESIADIYKSAIADENEIYDLFGVNFIGNEELKRLYMPEDWEGHPLRKDYVQDDTRLCWNDKDNV